MSDEPVLPAATLRRLVIVGLVIGVILGAVVFVPRISGYHSVVPQNRATPVESGG